MSEGYVDEASTGTFSVSASSYCPCCSQPSGGQDTCLLGSRLHAGILPCCQGLLTAAASALKVCGPWAHIEPFPSHLHSPGPTLCSGVWCLFPPPACFLLQISVCLRPSECMFLCLMFPELHLPTHAPSPFHTASSLPLLGMHVTAFAILLFL